MLYTVLCPVTRGRSMWAFCHAGVVEISVWCDSTRSVGWSVRGAWAGAFPLGSATRVSLVLCSLGGGKRLCLSQVTFAQFAGAPNRTYRAFYTWNHCSEMYYVVGKKWLYRAMSPQYNELDLVTLSSFVTSNLLLIWSTLATRRHARSSAVHAPWSQWRVCGRALSLWWPEQSLHECALMAK